MRTVLCSLLLVLIAVGGAGAGSAQAIPRHYDCSSEYGYWRSVDYVGGSVVNTFRLDDGTIFLVWHGTSITVYLPAERQMSFEALKQEFSSPCHLVKTLRDAAPPAPPAPPAADPPAADPPAAVSPR